MLDFIIENLNLKILKYNTEPDATVVETLPELTVILCEY